MKAFGEWTNSINIINDNFAFAGQYKDFEKDSFYNYYRDYNFKTGRYIQTDPIGLAGSLNTFAYVDNDPISYIDSSGLKILPCTRIDWEVCKSRCKYGTEGCYVQLIIRKPHWIFDPNLHLEVGDRQVYCDCFDNENDEPFCDGDCVERTIKYIVWGIGVIIITICTGGGAHA